ncbi:Unknown protein, partial [Striga hermonthica]
FSLALVTVAADQGPQPCASVGTSRGHQFGRAVILRQIFWLSRFLLSMVWVRAAYSIFRWVEDGIEVGSLLPPFVILLGVGKIGLLVVLVVAGGGMPALSVFRLLAARVLPGWGAVWKWGMARAARCGCAVMVGVVPPFAPLPFSLSSGVGLGEAVAPTSSYLDHLCPHRRCNSKHVSHRVQRHHRSYRESGEFLTPSSIAGPSASSGVPRECTVPINCCLPRSSPASFSPVTPPRTTDRHPPASSASRLRDHRWLLSPARTTTSPFTAACNSFFPRAVVVEPDERTTGPRTTRLGYHFVRCRILIPRMVPKLDSPLVYI